MRTLGDMSVKFETFLYLFENPDRYNVEETNFYFDDDPDETDHMIGYVGGYEKPYWAGVCDIPDGCEFMTAEELLTAKIYSGRSIKDRWEHLVLCNIGGLPAEYTI